MAASATKVKRFSWEPRSDRALALMRSTTGVLAINWLFQGMRGMDRKELAFRAGLEAALAVLLTLAGSVAGLGAPPAVAGGLLAAHSLMFALNGQLWVCARYSPRWHRDPAAIDRFGAALAAELRRLPWLKEAAVIGSRGRKATTSRSDIDLRLVFPRGPGPFWRVNLLLVRLRVRAFVARVPLDVYAYDSPASLRRFDQDEPLLLVLDRAGRLARLFPTRARPLPGSLPDYSLREAA